IHMATCVVKKIKNIPVVPANFENVPIFNPDNIEYSLINSKLINDYRGIFDKSYNNVKIQWVLNALLEGN
ncbi:1297_t:CDS:1, partial [Entrophospora sp. SA101]